MSLVTQLRSERATINGQIQALAQLEAAGTSLTAEQLAQVEQLSTQFNGLTEKLARAEAAERMATASAVPVSEGAQGVNGPPGSISGPFTAKPVPGANMAQMVRVLAASRGDQQAAAKMASDSGYNPEIAMALSTVTPGAGGVLVPQSFSSEVIELLRPKSVVRSLGAVSRRDVQQVSACRASHTEGNLRGAGLGRRRALERAAPGGAARDREQD